MGILDWICLRIDISDGLLWTRYRFHKMHAVSCLCVELLVNFFYLTHIVGHIRLIFQFAVTECPCISVQCIAVNIRCLLTIFKEGARKL